MTLAALILAAVLLLAGVWAVALLCAVFRVMALDVIVSDEEIEEPTRRMSGCSVLRGPWPQTTHPLNEKRR